jgi:OOP family OmpA-OmpF porin
MTNIRRIAGSALVALSFSACSTMREHPTACKVGSGVLGGALGALGGGLGVSEFENGPDNGERAAGAGVGLVAGGLIGALVGHYVCQPEASPPPPPPPAPLPPPAPGKKIETLSGPNFDFDKATLRPDGKQKLDHVVKMMMDNPGLRVSVEGHTDSIGSETYNQRLSERRADAARTYLVDKGISPSRIKTRGFGKSRPIASNKTEAGRAENRRVEIIAE